MKPWHFVLLAGALLDLGCNPESPVGADASDASLPSDAGSRLDSGVSPTATTDGPAAETQPISPQRLEIYFSPPDLGTDIGMTPFEVFLVKTQGTRDDRLKMLRELADSVSLVALEGSKNAIPLTVTGILEPTGTELAAHIPIETKATLTPGWYFFSALVPTGISPDDLGLITQGNRVGVRVAVGSHPVVRRLDACKAKGLYLTTSEPLSEEGSAKLHVSIDGVDCTTKVMPEGSATTLRLWSCPNIASAWTKMEIATTQPAPAQSGEPLRFRPMGPAVFSEILPASAFTFSGAEICRGADFTDRP